MVRKIKADRVVPALCWCQDDWDELARRCVQARELLLGGLAHVVSHSEPVPGRPGYEWVEMYRLADQRFAWLLRPAVVDGSYTALGYSADYPDRSVEEMHALRLLAVECDREAASLPECAWRVATESVHPAILPECCSAAESASM